MCGFIHFVSLGVSCARDCAFEIKNSLSLNAFEIKKIINLKNYKKPAILIFFISARWRCQQLKIRPSLKNTNYAFLCVHIASFVHVSYWSHLEASA